MKFKVMVCWATGGGAVEIRDLPETQAWLTELAPILDGTGPGDVITIERLS